jgi:hypothetical protein
LPASTWVPMDSSRVPRVCNGREKTGRLKVRSGSAGPGRMSGASIPAVCVCAHRGARDRGILSSTAKKGRLHMTAQALAPSPAQDLVEALDELSLVICRALGERCLMCHASSDGPPRTIDAEELEVALARVRRSLRIYQQAGQHENRPGH